jgi:predicted cupin superfamily sugar epimerase
MDASAMQLVRRLGMTPLPVEATYFVSTYRSEANTETGGPVGTAMIGLYSNDPPSRSLFHRLDFDEVWHFYGGDSMRLVLLRPDGTSADVIMGSDVLAGQLVQFVIPAGVWQAGELMPGGAWALFGCTMAPGFTGTCFEGGRINDLMVTHPDRHADIVHLGIPDDHGTSMPSDFAT